MGFLSFAGKIAVTAVAGPLLGPAVIPIGALAWSGSRAIEEACDDDDVKKVFGFIGDCGRDSFTGGAVGAVGGALAASSSKAAQFGAEVIEETENIAFHFCLQRDRDGLTRHISHKGVGIDYQEGCRVCEA